MNVREKFEKVDPQKVKDPVEALRAFQHMSTSEQETILRLMRMRLQRDPHARTMAFSKSN